MIKILLLVIIVSLLDSIYLFLMQKYTKIYNIQESLSSFREFIYSYGIWFIIALTIYYLIVSRPDFKLSTILKTAPILGITIFGIYGLNNMLCFPDKWSWSLVGIDIIRGITLVTISSIIISFIK